MTIVASAGLPGEYKETLKNKTKTKQIQPPHHALVICNIQNVGFTCTLMFQGRGMKMQQCNKVSHRYQTVQNNYTTPRWLALICSKHALFLVRAVLCDCSTSLGRVYIYFNPEALSYTHHGRTLGHMEYKMIR